MASSCVVPVVRLENVRPHADAEKLELADVLGFQVCIPKYKYKTGDVCIYFAADTLIPAEWADKFGVRQFLKGPDKDRVGRIRLRGEPSFGLVVDVPNIPPPVASVTNISWAVGENVADYFGARKYEAPIKIGTADMAPYDADIDPLFLKYTDIENGRIFTDVFKDGEAIAAIEKIHGRNNRAGKIKGVAVAGSHTTRKARPDEANIAANYDWFPWSLPEVKNLIEALSAVEGTESVILYGEVFGRSVQSLSYGFEKGKLGYRAFDLMVNGKYLDHNDFQEICRKYNVMTAPIIYVGEFSMAKIKEVADGKTTIDGADHIREGVVVRPLKERTDPKIGRVILKYIGTDYELSRHKDADTTDV